MRRCWIRGVGQGIIQHLVQSMLLRAIAVGATIDGEFRLVATTRSDVLQGWKNLILSGVFLKTELVAGDCDDLKAFRAVLLLQLIELRIVDLCRASEARNVDNQQHLSLVNFKRFLFINSKLL